MKKVSDEAPSDHAAGKFLQAGDAAKILGVHSATLIRWAKQGRIPAYAAPGKARTSWLFDVEEIAKVMRENSQQIAHSQRGQLRFAPLPRERIAEIAREIRQGKPLQKPQRSL